MVRGRADLEGEERRPGDIGVDEFEISRPSLGDTSGVGDG